MKITISKSLHINENHLIPKSLNIAVNYTSLPVINISYLVDKQQIKKIQTTENENCSQRMYLTGNYYSIMCKCNNRYSK